MQMKSETDERGTVLLFLLILTLALSFLFVKDATFFGDEGFHFTQIDKFLKFDFEVDGSITTIPGYHAFQALVARIMGERTLEFFRLVNLGLSIASVFLFYRTVRAIDPESRATKTIQYTFLPILFPFFFLLYTDVLSLFLALVAFSAYSRHKFAWAFLIAGLSVLVRQNNIIWFAFFVVSFFVETGLLYSLIFTIINVYRYFVSHIVRGKGEERTRSAPKDISISRARIIFNLGMCVVVFILFGIFLVQNGGIAIGDAGAHPFPQIHLGNVYFLLFLSGVFLLPLHLAHLRKILRFLWHHPFAAPICIGFFVFGMLTFANTHGYNQDIHSVFLRNRVLEYFTQTPLLMTAFFIVTTLAFLSLIVTKLHHPYHYLLYPFTILFLIPSWLIEQRYYLIPFVFFLLFRKPEHRVTEWMQAIYSIIFTAILYWIVASRWLFL